MQLITFIIGIIILVVLHEFGHFVAARALKVEVEEFGLGFPPRVMRMFRLWGTDFTLNWIPLGGFVRPKGENDPEVKGGLAAASPWVRLTVLFAGPATNLLIGIILGMILFYNLGKPVPDKVLVDFVEPGSPAAIAGLQVGDMVVNINNQNVTSQEILLNSIASNLGKQVTLVYQRADQLVSVTLVPRVSPPPGQGAIGIRMTNPRQPVTLWEAGAQGFQVAQEYITNLLQLPFRIIGGEASPAEGRLVGYKGMYEIYQQVFSPLWFFMIISISLGIGNLLPIPALDGGRILLIMPEILFRKRIPPRYENVIHMVGFALLLILLIYINIQDFVNPIQIPK